MDDDEFETGVIVDEESDDLMLLEQDEDDSSIHSNLSEEDEGGFTSRCHLDGFSFPGDEKDWN